MAGNKFDKRLLARRVRQGDVTQGDLDTHLNALPDVAENIAVVEAQLEPVDESLEEVEEGEVEGE